MIQIGGFKRASLLPILKPIFLLLIHLLVVAVSGQSLSGRIIQNDTYKTPLLGATVVIEQLKKGEITGLTGHFEIANVPAGTFHLKVSFVGFKTAFQEITTPLTSPLVIALEEDVTQLEGVEVRAQAIQSVQAAQTSLSTIKISDLPLTDIPRLLGEPDLIRMIQNLPGVKTESDFTGGFSVRGGRNDQNLILLDGVPVYNPWHMFGLFSAFNTEAIERVELTKGVFPAQYGSRVSSVLDIELQKGDKRLGAGYLTVSPISSTFSYGRPINQKTSYLLAVRRTYFDPAFWIINSLTSTSDATSKTKTRYGYNFLDLNAKVVHTFKPGIRLESGIFIGNDVVDLNQTTQQKQDPERNIYRLRYGWTNLTGSVKLIHENDRFKSVSHVFTSQYFSKNVNREDYTGQSQTGYEFSGGQIEGYAVTTDLFKEGFGQRFSDIGLQQDFSLNFTKNLTVFTGAQLLVHSFSEGTVDKSRQWGYPYQPGSGPITVIPDDQLIYNQLDGDTLISRSLEMSGYASAAFSLGKLKVYPGVRLVHYTLGTYTNLLPRVNLAYELMDHVTITTGYGHFSQYVQTVGFDLLRLPTERWFWANEDRKPVLAQTITAGIGYSNSKWGRFTIEGYYKKMQHLLNFSPARQAEALSSGLIPLFGAETVVGSGEAYGAEFLWHKNIGEFRGWLGYTYSWVWNTFPELNNGDRFPARTDKRHDIQTFWTYDFAKNWGLGILFNYKTGQPITFSTGNYLVNDDPLEIDDQAGDNQVIQRMNNFRLPAYHRMDVSLTWKNRKVFKRPAELSLNVINVYNRLNVLTANNGTSAQVLPNGKIRVSPRNTYTGQMPIIPMISLRIGLGGDAK